MGNLLYYIGGKWGYAISLIALLIAFYALPKYRVFIRQWRSSMYVLLFIVYACSFAYDCWGVYGYIKESQLKTEGYNFYITTYNYGFYFWAYFLYKMFVLIAVSFKTVWQTFIWGMFVLVMAFYEDILIWITSFARDYFPSSWSVRYQDYFGQIVLSFIIFNVAVALVYLIGKAWARFSIKTSLLQR